MINNYINPRVGNIHLRGLGVEHVDRLCHDLLTTGTSRATLNRPVFRIRPRPSPSARTRHGVNDMSMSLTWQRETDGDHPHIVTSRPR